jgi:hypothetical protein
MISFQVECAPGPAEVIRAVDSTWRDIETNPRDVTEAFVRLLPAAISHPDR